MVKLFLIGLFNSCATVYGWGLLDMVKMITASQESVLILIGVASFKMHLYSFKKKMIQDDSVPQNSAGRNHSDCLPFVIKGARGLEIAQC